MLFVSVEQESVDANQGLKVDRLLKKGLESYSKSDAGKAFTYSWRLPTKMNSGDNTEQYLACPMHEEPLLLIPGLSLSGHIRVTAWLSLVCSSLALTNFGLRQLCSAPVTDLRQLPDFTNSGLRRFWIFDHS